MKFEHPWFLLLLPLLLALWTALVIIAAARRRRKLAALLGNRAGDPEVVRLSGAVRYWKYWLLFAGCAALVLGLARPYWHKEKLPRSADGADVLVIFDVSRSMEAADPAPSRMEQGKYFFRELIKKDKSSRFGLIAFAGTAFQSSPLTSDRKVTEEYIDELSSATVPLGGTDIEKALTLALQIFDRDKESAHRAVVMITDGDELQGNFQALAKQFKAASIPIAVVGLGSPDKAVTIPDGRGGEVKSAYGETAYTKLNESALRKLAADSGGIYLRSTAFAPGVEEMSRFLEKLPRQKRDIAPAEQPRHTFIYFFLAGFILLILSLLLNERPRAKQAALWIAVLMVCGFQLAADSPAELYNLGRTYQQQGDYENALKCYNSLLASPDAGKELQNRALLNMGVLRHQQGRKEQQQIKALLAQQKLDEAGKISEQALKTLQNSGEYYSQALTHAGNSDTARKTAANLRQLAYNTAAVKKLQQQIKKLQEQRKKAQQDIKNEQDKNKQQQQQQQQQQGKGDKQQQQQQQQGKDDKQQQQQQQQSKGDKQQQQQQGKGDQQQPSEAEKSAEKLSRDARNLGQQKLADAAEKARQELEKARQSQNKKDFKQAEKHLDNAGKKLAPPPEKSDRKEQKPAGDGKNHSATPAPAKPDPGAADEKKLEILNDANRNMQQRHHDSQQRLRRGAFPPVEKDW